MKSFSKKQIISLILVFALIFSLVPFGAFTSYAIKDGYSASIEEGNLNLGTAKPGYEKTDYLQHFRVTNTGTQGFYWSQTTLELSGENANCFTTAVDGNGYIAPGATKEDKYYVLPVDGLTAGTYNATITLSLADDESNTAVMDTIDVTFTVSEHNFSQEWASDNRYHWHDCLDENCQVTTEYVEHDDNTIKNAVEPTFDTDGYTGDRYCSVCDHKVANGGPIAAGKYIRVSNATMTPNTLIAGNTPSDYTITSSEPSKYTATVGNWWDLTTSEQITSSTPLIEDHEYRIVVDFAEVAPYVYNEENESHGSRFYVNNEEIGTTMSVAFSTYRTYDTICIGSETPLKYYVTFESNGGSAVERQKVTSGENAVKPSDPTYGGFNFLGWYTESTFVNKYLFNTPVTSNIKLYAKWEPTEPVYTIRYDFNGGNRNGASTYEEHSVAVGLIFSVDNLITRLNVTAPENKELEAVFVDGVRYELDDGCILSNDMNIQYIWQDINGGNQGGGNPQQNYQDIEFDLSWTNTFVNVWINNKGVMEESQDFESHSFEYKGVVVQNAGNTDPSLTNVIRLQNRFGDLEVTEYTINGVHYVSTNEGVTITEEGWFITVEGASKYTISGAGDDSIATPKTIIWANLDADKTDENYSDDMLVEHGSAKVIGVYNGQGEQIAGESDADDQTRMGWIVVTPGDDVVFEFIPEYGYQLTGVSANGIPLEPQDTANQYKFTMPDANIHFSATFQKVDDIVVANSSKVNDGTIVISNNEFEGGSAALTISDVQLTPDKIEGFENAAGDYTISNYLDIDLYNIFYKGNSDDDYWANKIDELENEATITIKLAEGINANDIVLVHNIHNGDTYEIIPIDSYDPVTNTITFRTSSFSNYAIASKTIANDTEETTDDTTSNNETTEEVTDTAEKTTKTSSPNTGDDIMLWVSLMIASVLGTFATHIMLRKRY